MDASNTTNPTSYIELLAEYDRYLSGYVYNLIPNAADAEDVLQDIKVALWKAFDQYQEGTNFGA
jgi:RNA polymerase sigma-70 factor (ECF subfamily)